MIPKYFLFEQLQTSYKKEIIGGFTTFVTMAYIIIVNPKILETAGLPFEASMAATIWTAFIGTLLMGVYAKRPFAIAPYMGENAFIAYTVVKVLGYSWQTALGAIFISGIFFTLLTVLKMRSWLANAVPDSLKISFAVGIGFFLTFIGLNDIGLITLGVPGAPVKVGNLHNIEVILGIISFLSISYMIIKKVNGAILIGITGISVVGILLGVTQFPQKVFSSPASFESIMFQIDIVGALSWGFIAVIITILITDFVDTMGTLLGMGYKANLLDEKGNLPEIEKPMLCDALSTIIASLLGTTTAGVFIESAAGIEAGGKSGFSAVVTAFLFLSALFLAPLFIIIPAYAYGSALIVVGLLMIAPISKLDFSDLPNAVPAFATITLMSFTYNLGIGMTAGFLLYPLMMLVTGKTKIVHPGMWILFFFSILFYVFYPY
ncbi:MAG: NCS2 family permease [Ignavibacteriaceae bacterium]|nr:NCS2 family permease [Ignavibacteriaceae bacterium]